MLCERERERERKKEKPPNENQGMSNIEEEGHALFTTNGMFIIDEIVNNTTGERFTDIVGGGGTFAALGATIVACSNYRFDYRNCNSIKPSQREIQQGVKFIVDCGKDFPYTTVKPQLDQWGVGIIYREDPTRLTTRGYNEYGPGDFRNFEYQTAKKQVVGQDFQECIRGNIEIMHLVCSASRVVEILKDLLSPNQRNYKCKKYVWEPLPTRCTLIDYQDIYNVLNNYIDKGIEIILSPNAEEAFQLFYGKNVIEPSIEYCITHLKEKIMELTQFPVVIRCGAQGCILFMSSSSDKVIITPQVFPAYHKLTPEEVKEPTGGGNTFLGAFATGLVLYQGDLSKSCICGNIASGIVIEQKGLPQLSVFENDDRSSTYRWNGKTFEERWEYYENVIMQSL